MNGHSTHVTLKARSLPQIGKRIKYRRRIREHSNRVLKRRVKARVTAAPLNDQVADYLFGALRDVVNPGHILQ